MADNPSAAGTNPPNANDVMEAVTALRAEFDKKSPDFDKIVKIETVLEAQEAKNQELLMGKKVAEK